MDILVNNAANDDRHRVADITREYWDARLAVNLRHYFFCAQSVLPSMKAAGKGVVVNVGSISWHLALPEIAVYQTAKAGIEGLTRALARDLGGDGIRVTCVVPGGVRTQLARRSFPDALQPSLHAHPWREAARLFAHRAGLTSLVRHETGLLRVDAIYHSLDRRVARRLR